MVQYEILQTQYEKCKQLNRVICRELEMIKKKD